MFYKSLSDVVKCCATPSRSCNHTLGVWQLANIYNQLPSILWSCDHMITICNLLCQLLQKVNGEEASRGDPESFCGLQEILQSWRFSSVPAAPWKILLPCVEGSWNPSMGCRNFWEQKGCLQGRFQLHSELKPSSRWPFRFQRLACQEDFSSRWPLNDRNRGCQDCSHGTKQLHGCLF